MENKMTYLKLAAFTFLFTLIMACSGTKNEEIDYTQITDAEMMQMANKKMNAGEYENAILDYKKLLLDFPTSSLHIDVQLKIAEAYGKLDKFEDQMNQLHRLVKENIIPRRVPRIYVQLGKFYERSAMFNPGIATTDSVDYRDAIVYYDNALKYPDSDDSESKSEAVYRRALVEAKIGLIDDATSRYRLVSSLFPDSDYSILSQIKLKDPSDTSELATTDSAMTVYRQTLGLGEVSKNESEEEIIEEVKEAENVEDTVEEVKEAEQESTIESTIDNLDQPDEGQPEEEDNLEEDPDEETQEPAEELFAPAVEDSSGSK